jgi:hypothetical protein
MLTRGEQFFAQLQDAPHVHGLIGQSENSYFDCKEWPSNDSEAQKTIAKAACGLTNAEGGVLLFGMKARKADDEPDVVDSAAPVKDTSAVSSKILDLVGQLVEPGIQGIRVNCVNDPPTAKSGFVIVYIPRSDGPPRRSRKDWKFYLRIGSGTFPMEYFQIEERFGRGPRAKLEVCLEMESIKYLTSDPITPCRWFVLGLKNTGLGAAKFPSIRYRYNCGLMVDRFGIDGNGGFGLPRRAAETGWEAFRGGMDEIIYPEEIRKIAKLYQRGENAGIDETPSTGTAFLRDRWLFKATSISCEVSSDGNPTAVIDKPVPEDSQILPRSR